MITPITNKDQQFKVTVEITISQGEADLIASLPLSVAHAYVKGELLNRAATSTLQNIRTYFQNGHMYLDIQPKN